MEDEINYYAMHKKSIKQILCDWDNSAPNGLHHRVQERRSRRDFLKMAGLLSASMLIPSCDNSNTQATTDKPTTPLLSQAPWQTFASVQNHLFPKSSDSPSADDVNATLYLKSVLALPGIDDADKQFLRDGVNWTNDIAVQMTRQPFHKLNQIEKETVLQRIATSSAGENWLSLLLLYIFEALLTDPVYGGNTNKIGWQWLEHKPGFPTPSKDKRYYNLL